VDPRVVKAPKYSGGDFVGAAPTWPYDIHQYSDKAFFPGGNGPGDANITDFTAQTMLDKSRRAAQPPQPPQGIPMPPRRAMWSPNCDDRPRNVTWLCFHTQEGNGTADSLARYLDNPASGVSYNTVGDAAELIDVVPFDKSPWAALGANGRADHFCFGGSFSAWSRQQWLDCGMLDNAAAWLADRATVRGLPIAYVGTDGVRNNQPGVIGHVDWTRGAGEGSHTDPGPNFPWDELIARAQRLTAPPTPKVADVEQPQIDQLNRIEALLAQGIGLDTAANPPTYDGKEWAGSPRQIATVARMQAELAATRAADCSRKLDAVLAALAATPAASGAAVDVTAALKAALATLTLKASN